jgi:nitrate reductase (NAD(P)H)
LPLWCDRFPDLQTTLIQPLRSQVPVPLIEREELTHDTRRYRFGLPSTKHRLGLPCGKHAFMYARINGELVMRAYTPTSRDEELGYVDFVIKVYFAGSPSFPDGGKMSQHLDQMKLGDTIELKGPVGHFHYTGKGTYSIDGVAKTTTHISAVAGGTGVTPIYQVIRAIIADPEDTTQLSLIFANRTPGDILLRKELDSFAAEDERIKVLMLFLLLLLLLLLILFTFYLSN